MANNNVVNRTVNIFIQSGEAQKALDALIKKETRLKDELEKAANPKVIERLKAELDKLAEPLDRAAKKVSGQLEPSLRDTQATVRSLTNELNRMSASDDGFEERVAHLRQANTELDAQKGKVGLLRQTLNSFWKEAKTVAVGVIVGNTVQTMLESVLGYVTGMVTGSAKIADELSDIEKTTNLSKEDVAALNQELAKIDTRTSSSELRKLAAEGGKLGNETVEDVKKFVEQADKIKVALGEDLGEDAIVSIGKLSKIFKTEMLNIGSAINEIGAKSEASERFSVDFLNRLAGTGPAVNLAAGDLLGYGAALEIAGQTAEVSGTALSTFFIEFVRDSEKFGEAAGFAKGELTNLINTKGTNAGFLEFLTRLKEANPDTAKFLEKMQQLGIDGSRGANVMLALSNNIQGVKDQQLIANDAIQSNASIMNEFNKKNNNAAAELDKLKKNFAGLFASSTIQEGGAAAVRVLNSLVNVLKATFKFIGDNKVILASLTLVYIALTASIEKTTFAKLKNLAATAAKNIADGAELLLTRARTAAMLIQGNALNLLAGRITLLTFAQRAYNAVAALGAGPIGILLVAVGALAIGISSLVGNTQKLTAEQRVQAELATRVADATTDQVTKIQTLVSVIDSEKTSLDGKKKALQELIAINPEFAKTLSLDAQGHLLGKQAIDQYITSLKNKALAEAQYSLLVDKQKQLIDAKETSKKTGPYIPRAGGGADVIGTTIDFFGFGDNAKAKEASDKVSDLEEQVATLAKTYENDTRANLENAAKATTAISAGVTQTTGVLEGLRTTLKSLQEQREKATDSKALGDFNKKITATQALIRKYEGGVTKVSAATKKAGKDTQALADELQRIADELQANKLPEDAREIFQLRKKYEKLQAEAKGNKKLLTEVDRLYFLEYSALLDRQLAKNIEALKKNGKTERDFAEERRKNLELLNPLRANLEGSALNLNAIIGRDKTAKDELALIKNNGKDRYNEELRQLKERQRLELDNTNLTENEKLLIKAKYFQLEQDLYTSFLQANFKLALDFAGQTLNIANILGSAKTEKENAELARDKAANDKKKENLQKRLKSGVLSQQEYDRQVQKIEKAQEKREKEIRLKQFKRDQRAQVTQALMSGANAVVSTLAARPGSLDVISLGVFRAINIGLAVAATAAQVAAIASKKAPEYARGGLLNGKSHAAGGMGVYDHNGTKVAEAEGGEGFINKFSMRSAERYAVAGTTSQIASFLNSRNGGGIQWAPGATPLRPAWKEMKPAGFDFSAIRKAQHFAQGGVLNSAPTPPAPGDGGSLPFMQLLDVMAVLSGTVGDLNQQLARGIRSSVVLSDVEQQQERLDTIREEATMK